MVEAELDLVDDEESAELIAVSPRVGQAGVPSRSWRLPAAAVAALAALAAGALIVSGCVTAPRESALPLAPSTTTPSAAASPGLQASEQPAPSSTLPNRSAKPSIGYISLDESQAFVRSVSAGIRAAADEAGIELVTCDSGWTRSGVQACATRLSEAGVHGLLSFQPFPDLAADVCAATGDAPTIGIVYDQGPCQVALLEIDQAESGRLAGEAMGRFAAERWDCDVAAYVSLESEANDPIGGARMDGYRAGYQEHCELPQDSRSLGGAQHLATAKTQVAALLGTLKGRPILVAGVSDIAILGAMEAAAAAGRSDQLWYGGQLADATIHAEIACNDHYIASVAQFPERFGQALVPALVDAVEGRPVPPRMEAELEVVTAANVRSLFPDTPLCDE
jgi:ribose transport system substrate-binding protein